MTFLPLDRSAAALAAALALVGLVPGDEQYLTWTGTDPARSPCVGGGDVRAAVFARRSDEVTLTMRYSGVCRTVWATLEGSPPGTRAWVARPDGGAQSCSADAAGSCTTRLLDDANVQSCAYAAMRGDTVRTDCW